MFSSKIDIGDVINAIVTPVKSHSNEAEARPNISFENETDMDLNMIQNEKLEAYLQL